ncbi:hypothetical protein MCSF7_02734 [Mycoplasmopsis columbina SF7]|uniref:Thoeris protein ThsB TIR-like domain-containing protein n=1 Tax=Mycoplasmopsis columbina SF7 TaxID=1037410 RepID=F9UJ89_9BACT|nr:TIR domain-containing protein [Mycoplasmopsis columbina]EGV00585.1 hypothetical protein MCSF7_02734 [Mycoplasmopsis columbina SF7]
MSKTKYFLSYSHEHENKDKIQKIQETMKNWGHAINLSEREDKSKYNDETIWNYLKERISDSSLTILLYSEDLEERNKYKIEPSNNFRNSGWIYNEISASLRDWKDNRINALICVIDEKIENDFFYHDTIRTYKLPQILYKNEEYIVFAKYSKFINDNNYLDEKIKEALKNRKEQIEKNKFNINYELHRKRW